jgi:hypothetical protein
MCLVILDHFLFSLRACFLRAFFAAAAPFFIAAGVPDMTAFSTTPLKYGLVLPVLLPDLWRLVFPVALLEVAIFVTFAPVPKMIQWTLVDEIPTPGRFDDALVVALAAFAVGALVLLPLTALVRLPALNPTFIPCSASNLAFISR